MKSFDVFSGIGGITHGLRHVASPTAYCDNDDFCRDVLQKLMREGRIPAAPILGDVKSVRAADVGPVDIVVGGSPCVGFSMAGKRRGLRDAASGLYAEFSRLVGELGPEHVFFENVAALVQSDDFRAILEDLGGMGYACRWTTLYASDVGAPQKRRRVFLLASKSTPPIADPPEPHDWTTEPCPRMVELAPTARKKFKALGNAAVPDQVAGAYAWLSKTWNARTLQNAPKWDGAYVDGAYYASPAFPRNAFPRNARDIEIELDPDAFVTTKPLRNKTPKLADRVVLKAWGTPRSAFVNANAVLTARGAKDLPTQLRFEIRTPDETRGLHPNPDWITWLQGFPCGWL